MSRFVSFGPLSVLFLVSLANAAVPDCSRLEELTLRMRVTSSNIENAESTRSPEGGPYRRKTVLCGENGCEIQESRDVRRRLIPDHPDADASGYVSFPLIDVSTEWSTLAGLQDEYDRTAARCRTDAD